MESSVRASVPTVISGQGNDMTEKIVDSNIEPHTCICSLLNPCPAEPGYTLPLQTV